MISRNELLKYLETQLCPSVALRDPSNNGLQVEGREQVARIGFGVDASLEFFSAAAEWGADFLIVHHGISWREIPLLVTGTLAARLRLLLNRGISLYASHLPLDMHPNFGNNAVISHKLGLRNLRPFGEYGGAKIGFAGELPEPMSATQLLSHVENNLESRNPALFNYSTAEPYRTVAIVSGGAGDMFDECKQEQVQAIITGEFMHQDVAMAKENGVTVIAAGHYCTETFGVRALQEQIEKKLGIECRFFDLPTGL